MTHYQRAIDGRRVTVNGRTWLRKPTPAEAFNEVGAAFRDVYEPIILRAIRLLNRAISRAMGSKVGSSGGNTPYR